MQRTLLPQLHFPQVSPSRLQGHSTESLDKRSARVTVPDSPSSGSYICAGYADYDAAVSIASTASGSPANQRWLVSGTDSWTDTTGANTHTANYYLQDSTTVSYSIIGGAGSSSAPTLTYTYLGTHWHDLFNDHNANGSLAGRWKGLDRDESSHGIWG